MCSRQDSLGGGSKVALTHVIRSLVPNARFADLEVWRGGRSNFLFKTSRLMHRGDLYLPQYEEETLTWSRQQNVALEQINA